MNETSLSLLCQLRESDQDSAWNQLHSIYRPLIQKWLLKYDLQPNDADDMAQEVLLAVAKDVASFDHNGRDGAFRAWMKGILVNRLRNFWRTRDRRPAVTGGTDIHRRLDELDDPASEMTLAWNREHDQYVLGRLLMMVKPQFKTVTWNAFHAVTIAGEKPNDVAEKLGVSLNAIFIAKSRVLSRLRQEAAGLVESSSTFFPTN